MHLDCIWNSNEDAVFSIIRNLSKKGYDLLSNLIGKHHKEKEVETTAAVDSDDLKRDRDDTLSNFSEPSPRRINILRDNNASKILTEKDGSEASVKQPGILDQNRDVGEDESDFKAKTINSDWWNSNIDNTKTDLINARQKNEPYE